ncbi:glutathione S-transferase family protein [uncultured Nitratireductor sp.]|uniref:glutathione S-transferase family protein n=1 Tax=uncultured Nitratireductor sp. TaxID=520953 RepID=UPI0025F71CBF|nr:glutathione S-transferase family protein [uncultured Nitratireductor sp.]
MPPKPRLFGAHYSVYVRIARLALLEKGVDHDCVPVDIFSSEGVPDWYLERHPFRRIPAFEHGTLRLFETTAITRYVDEAFTGPALQYSAAAARALTNQIVGLIDAYAYRAMVWDVYVERLSKPKNGGLCDEARIARGLDTARTCLTTLAQRASDGPWLAGDRLTLADLHAAPVFAYFALTEEGAASIEAHPAIAHWWDRMQARDSMASTAFETS